MHMKAVEVVPKGGVLLPKVGVKRASAGLGLVGQCGAARAVVKKVSG